MLFLLGRQRVDATKRHHETAPTIDVWWLDTVENGVLPLVVAHLLMRHEDFREAKLQSPMKAPGT